ncbi:MAG: SPASM domain-containing protein [Candidatus Hydrogenedentota bacterium]|nr:MAG: SPASM domain-containing protein [Candidatus Hydrogenedentota bacterium]
MTNYYVSKYTFLTPKAGTEEFLIINYLAGSADLLTKEEAEELKLRLETGNFENYPDTRYLLEQGYIFHSAEEESRLLKQKYKEFQEEYEKTPTQLIFSTTYVCNFGCFYCFQEEYHQKPKMLTQEITDAFFRYINKKFQHESPRPYITLFGGETLLIGKSFRKNIEYFLKQARDFQYEVAIITNGYYLLEYLPFFQKEKIPIKEIQVSLDGDKEAHDKRRVTKSGKATFIKIARGIDAALKAGYRINLRPIVDKDNIESLPRLAEFCNTMGWLDYPVTQFETTIGRNYELHTCQPRSRLFTRSGIWEAYLALSKQYPLLRKFHRPNFHGMKVLHDSGQLPMPIFDGCPAGKKEWAFDINGYIYGCTASVGVEKFKLGSFLEGKTNGDEFTDKEQLEIWKQRNVLNMPECKNCAVSLACGGGCGVLSYNQKGHIHASNCRPVADLVSYGADFYSIGEENATEPVLCC